MVEYEFLAEIIRIADVEDIRSLVKACADMDVTFTPASVVEVARRNSVIVARDASREGRHPVIGIAVLASVATFTETSGRIEQIFIDPRFRGLGIANEFVRRLTERGVELGFAHVDVQTRLCQDRAHHTKRKSFIRGINVPEGSLPKKPASG